jgi:hypothetical protein
MTQEPAAPADPALEARIQHALAPYVGRLTDEALAEARLLLTVALTTHPVLAPLMDQVCEQAAGSSGVVQKDEPGQDDDLPAAESRGGAKV